MRGWRSNSQSMASYNSSSVASLTPSSSAKVVLCHCRVVASLEQGSSKRCTIMASTKSRSRQGWEEIMASRPSLRTASKTASTWPWGKVFWVESRSWGETRVSSRSRRRKVSIFSGGQEERFAKVRWRVLLPSRQPWRRRMAGGELRLGMTEMYMRTLHHNYHRLSSTNMFTTWEHFHSPKLALRANESKTYLRI